MLAKLLGIRIFDIEASSLCNVSCKFCPRDALPNKGQMSLETFERFLDRVPLSNTDTLSFVGMGEPTLNRRLPDFLRLAKARYPGVRTWVTTNGTNLSPKTLPALLDAGLDTLDISFNGLDPETYETLMPGAKYDRTLANIDYALKLIAQRGDRTRVQIAYVVPADEPQVEAGIQAFWKTRGVRHFRPARLHDRAGLVKLQGMAPPDRPALRRPSCDIFEAIHYLTWQGELLYCCHDVRRDSVIGDIHTSTWQELMQRKLEIREQNRWPEMCQRCTDPLRHDMWQQLDAQVRTEIPKEIAASIKQVFVGGRRRPAAKDLPAGQTA